MATNKRMAAVEKSGLVVYEVLSNLNHDGESFAPGDQVSLDDVIAKALVDAGVVKPAEVQP